MIKKLSGVLFSYLAMTVALAENPPEPESSSDTVVPIETVEIRDASGELLLPGGGVYRGEIFEHMPQGKGTISYSNGEQYEGHFLDGKKTGEGTLRLVTGDQLSAFWVDDRRMGDVSYRFADGRVYQGELKAKKAHGYGVMNYPSGETYTGYWAEGVRQGMGLLEENGRSFIGAFANNQRYGKGYEAVANGSGKAVWCENGECSSSLYIRFAYFLSRLRLDKDEVPFKP